MIAKKARKPKAEKTEKATPPNLIVQYIRRGQQETRGVMAAVSVGDKFSVGYSLVNKAAGDRFNKKRGLEQAITRAKRNINKSDLFVPASILSSMQVFTARAQKYFVDKTIRGVVQKGGPSLSNEEVEKLFKSFDGLGLQSSILKPVTSTNDNSDAMVALRNSGGEVKPRESNEYFVNIGNDSLLIRKVNGNYIAVKV